jgi:hypothetical protein
LASLSPPGRRVELRRAAEADRDQPHANVATLSCGRGMAADEGVHAPLKVSET